MAHQGVRRGWSGSIDTRKGANIGEAAYHGMLSEEVRERLSERSRKEREAIQKEQAERRGENA